MKVERQSTQVIAAFIVTNAWRCVMLHPEYIRHLLISIAPLRPVEVTLRDYAQTLTPADKVRAAEHFRTQGRDDLAGVFEANA